MLHINNRYELLAEKAIERNSTWRAMLGEVYRLVKYVRIEAGCDKVPTPLLRLARHLNVYQIREVPLAMHGRLMKENGSIAIEVNTDLSHFEKRQTIAHELGHLIIEKRLIELVPRREERATAFGGSLHKMDKLCDEAASEILLPLQWLRSHVLTSRPSLNLCHTLASESVIPLDYFVAKISDKKLWSCRFIWWEKQENGVIPTKSYPSTNIEFTIQVEDFQSSLIVRSLIEQKYMEGKERLVIQEEKGEYQIQCLPLDKSKVLTMIIFS